jgi:quinolinate synthase
MEKIVWSLEDMQYKISVPKAIREKAKKALDKMVEILPAR